MGWRRSTRRVGEALRWVGQAASEAAEGALDLVFPPACGACEAWLPCDRNPVHAVLCPDCAEALEPVGAGACPVCAAPGVVPGHAPHGAPTPGADVAPHGAPTPGPNPAPHGAPTPGCPDCQRIRPTFSAVYAAYLYGGPLLEALHALKYDRRPHLGPPLGRLLAARLPAAAGAEIVVPVPAHPRRIRERGFDPTYEIAAAAAAALGRPLLPDALRKRRPTPPQAGLSLAARLGNLKGAVTPGRSARHLTGRRVLLMDDVLTTGATASACAEALRHAGAVAIEVAVLARAE